MLDNEDRLESIKESEKAISEEKIQIQALLDNFTSKIKDLDLNKEAQFSEMSFDSNDGSEKHKDTEIYRKLMI